MKVPRRSGLAAIAHDLHNPLAVIEFSAARLTREAARDAGDIQRVAQAIQRSVRCAERLVRDLREIETEGLLDVYPFSVRPARVAAVELLSDAVAAAEPLAINHTLIAEEAPDLPVVWADAERIRQVFGNLIDNAVKYSPPGGAITVSARAERDEVHFLVADRGPGVKPEDRARIFAPFWRADAKDRNGRGLGLWICRQIIESHGGRIWVEGPAEGGAVFHFTLPRGAGALEAA